MLQAARSGKQNIVEGSADGASSTEMELKLLNIARASIKELKEDYEDYLNTRNLLIWNKKHPKFSKMLEYCRIHNQSNEYEPLLPKMSDEKIANMALTLCHMIDKMMMKYQGTLEKRFVAEGGIHERMTAARLGYRNQQQKTITELNHKIQLLEQTNMELRNRIIYLENLLKEN